jgi:hypothetical protein
MREMMDTLIPVKRISSAKRLMRIWDVIWESTFRVDIKDGAL